MTSYRNPQRPFVPPQNSHSWPTSTVPTAPTRATRPHAYSRPTSPALAVHHTQRGQVQMSPERQRSPARRPSTKTSPRIQVLLAPTSRRANALLQGAPSTGRTLSRTASLEQVLAQADSQAASLAPTDANALLRSASLTSLTRTSPPVPPYVSVSSRPALPSVPSRPTTPSVPSRPTTPSVPSRPTTPSVSSRSTTPSIPSRSTSPAPSLLRPSSPARPVRHSNLDIEEMKAFYMSHPHGELIAQAVAVMRRLKTPHREPIEKILPDVAKVLARLEPEVWQYRTPDSPEYKFWTELMDLYIRVLELKERCVREQKRSSGLGVDDGVGAGKYSAEKARSVKRWWKLKKRRSRVVSPPTTDGNQVDGESFGKILHILTRRKRRNAKKLQQLLYAAVHQEN